MKLNKKQKEHLIACIAEGLQSDEINKRAAKFKPAYSVSRQQVDFYRSSRGVVLEEIKEASESDALKSGLALKEKRVEALAELADKIKAELLEGGKLWLTRPRAVGSGEWAVHVDEEHFNAGQVNTLRALLDDIAKEMNARTYQRRDAIEEELPDDEDLDNLTDEELEEIARGGA